jgi:hypothetical protein
VISCAGDARTVDDVPHFLLEVYVAAVAAADAAVLARRARAAAESLSATGRPVRCLQSIVVAEDETCLFLFEAGAADDVREAAERADLRLGRISDVAIAHPGDAGSAGSTPR